jgi:uncharacterized protein YcfJ
MSMRSLKLVPLGAAALLVLQGCVTPPPGPQIVAMPGPNKPFAVFQQDRAVCIQFADEQAGRAATDANNRQLGTAAIGTVLGAALGAAVGGGRGAGVGAASGAIFGTAAGAGPAARAQHRIQYRYDALYAQCMYSRGNQVPGFPAPQAPPPPPPPR